jgi:hypothetical protein
MNNLSIIRRCASVEEAVVVNSMLRDGGFESRLEDWNIASTYWLYVTAFGGVRISVPRSQLISASKYMFEMERTAEQRLIEELGPPDKTPLRPRYFLAFTMLFLVFHPLFPFAVLFLLCEYSGILGLTPSTKKTGYNDPSRRL